MSNKYLVVIGTSHTDGDCDGKRSQTSFVDFLHDHIGMQTKKYGLSGAENIELLQMTNELVTNGVLNSKFCAGVVLEPRVTSVTFPVPYEWYTDIEHTDAYKEGMLNANTGIGLSDWSEKKVHMNWEYTGTHQNVVNKKIYTKPNPFNNDREFYVSGFPNRKQGTEYDSYFQTGVGKTKMNKFLHSIQDLLVLYSESKFSHFNNYILMTAIKNIVQSKGIPFRWFSFDIHDFSSFENYSNYDNEINKTHLSELRPNLYPGYMVCKCKHLNQIGHDRLAKELAEQLRNVI